MTTARRSFLLLLPLFLVAGSSVTTAQWLSTPGSGWIQAATYHHNTRRQFGPLRELRDFPEEGHAVTTSLFLTGSVGVLKGIDVWFQVPVHRLRFDDFLAERTSIGVGDPLFHIRVGPELFGIKTIPIAVRAGLKLPGGDFPIDAEIIPLGEGQRDWEVMLELGHSFWPAPLYAAGWVGYRWREENTDASRKPGNERFLYAAMGGDFKGFTWKVAVEAIQGEAWQAFGLSLPTARRRLFQISPTVGRRLGPGALELGARMPLAGQNYPAGPALIVGYFTTWKLK